MKQKNMKMIIIAICLLLATAVKSQINPADYNVSAEKEKQYLPYVKYKHSLGQDFETWKNTNKILYRKEIWYYSESFYIKRNVSDIGFAMDASQIDISRFETNRKENEEATINIEGFKDAIILLPNNKLIYKPE
jgi:hypothetical protein